MSDRILVTGCKEGRNLFRTLVFSRKASRSSLSDADISTSEASITVRCLRISSKVRATAGYATRTNSQKVNVSGTSHAVHLFRLTEVAALIEEASSHPQ